METNTSTYKLDQAGKEYYFTTSIVEDKIRLACRNSSSPKNKKYIRDFSIEQLRKLDKLFNVLKTPIQAIKYIDEALRQQKVGVTEEANTIKITFYITTKGITNQIDIPLNDPSMASIKSNGNEYSIQQTDKIENYDITNKGFDSNNYDQYLNNMEYTQDKQIISNENFDYNQYQASSNIEGTENIYTQEQNIQNDTGFDMNKYFSDMKTNTNTESAPYISPADNEDDTNKIFQQYQAVENTTTTNTDINQYNTNEYINENTNFNYDEQFKKILEQQNVNVNTDINNININTETNIITTQAQEKEINRESKPLTTTKVLPVKTTTRVLPPIGPFTSLQGLDLHKLGIMNSEHQKMPPYEQMFETPTETPRHEIKANYYEYNFSQPEIVTTEGTKATKTTKTTTTITTTNVNNNNNFNINSTNNYLSQNVDTIIDTNNQVSSPQTELVNKIKFENASLKKQINELRQSQSQLQNVTITQNQLAELDSLRKKVAEVEILRGQLKDLNNLRIKVAEYNVKIKEINTLKEKINNQNKEIAQLRIKAAEADKLRKRVNELEEIKSRYEIDIKGLKESLRLYSIKTSSKEEKEVVEDDTPEEVTVKGDIIHDINELELITKKINHKNQKLTLNLLYKATADSDKAAAFHAKCDDAKSSIVLIETDKGKRFGGFTKCSWSGDCIEKKDEEAFVFSLDKMKTYDNIPGDDAIGCYPKFGPIFLGCQIRIYDKAFEKGGTTFERGLNFDTEEDFELTGGDRQFNVKEIEVYEVIYE